MAKLKYKTQSVNSEIDPRGGYICRVVNADPVEDDAVFQEVIDSPRWRTGRRSSSRSACAEAMRRLRPSQWRRRSRSSPPSKGKEPEPCTG